MWEGVLLTIPRARSPNPAAAQIRRKVAETKSRRPGGNSTGVSDDADSQEREAPIVKLGPEHEPRVDAQDLVPWFSTHQDAPLLEGAHARSKRGFDPLAIAAGIAALGLIGIGCLAAYDHVRQSAMFAVKAQESENLAANVDMLKGRLDALEASRGHDDAADLHKLLGEIKAGAAATQAFGASFAQLSARVDKLGERIDHDFGGPLRRYRRAHRQAREKGGVAGCSGQRAGRAGKADAVAGFGGTQCLQRHHGVDR